MERTIPPRPKLSENLSSDTLFTFTNKAEYLISMLANGIYPRYIYERIPISNKTWYYTVAAKCFCDIPLGKIKAHLNWFGNYGLGIKKSYLKEKGVSPIMYIHNNSNWIVDALIKGGIKNLRAYPTLPFLKRHNGWDFMREDDGSYSKKFRVFYDEREWRFVPESNDLETGSDTSLIQEGIEQIRNKNITSPYNKSNIKLNSDVIEYIIIDSFAEFKDLKSSLKKTFPDPDEYELMISKILIAERILRDF
jgi:hypothetical protein